MTTVIYCYMLFTKGKENMRIIINNSSMIPIYEQIMSQIKDAILSGDLGEGSALPSVRVLAADLKISSLTVKKAYDFLEEEGFITTVHGKGSFVTKTDTQLALEARRRAVEEELARIIEKALSSGMRKEEIRETVSLILEE